MPLYNSDENNLLSSLESTYREMLNEKKKRYEGPMTGPEADKPQKGDEDRRDVDGSPDPVKQGTYNYPAPGKAKLEGDTYKSENEGFHRIGPGRTRNMKYHRDTVGLERPDKFRFSRKKVREPGKVRPRRGGEAQRKLVADRKERAKIRNNPELYPGKYKHAEKTGKRPDATSAHKTQDDRKRKTEQNRAKLERDFKFPS